LIEEVDRHAATGQRDAHALQTRTEDADVHVTSSACCHGFSPIELPRRTRDRAT
jgi:hypothetical protein